MKTKRVALRGHKIEGLYYIKPSNVMLLSSYSLDVENVKIILEAIRQYNAPILHVYPSSVYLLAKIIKDNQLTLSHHFKLIALSSEPLMQHQKNLIKDVFHTNLSHWYGHTEKAVLAGYCEKEDTFHIYPQYGITEILNSDGSPTPAGKTGEIVGTSFWNLATPFVRYKTQDFAEVGADSCASCGRNYKILNRIEGRLQDYVIDKDGHLISLTALIFAQHFKAFENIVSLKLEQYEKGIVNVNIVPDKHFSPADQAEVKQVMQDVTGGRLTVNIHITDKIERTKAGKQPFLKQNLNVNEYL
ncbi:hypothetical protein [Saccharicrinis sp. FJH54]|uniref:hypothetical protein n=1 Tax=Saccharicrinis sp. FJH54 TaxID=3344665 RepID=UPI0035D4D3F5